MTTLNEARDIIKKYDEKDRILQFLELLEANKQKKRPGLSLFFHKYTKTIHFKLHYDLDTLAYISAVPEKLVINIIQTIKNFVESEYNHLEE